MVKREYGALLPLAQSDLDGAFTMVETVLRAVPGPIGGHRTPGSRLALWSDHAGWRASGARENLNRGSSPDIGLNILLTATDCAAPRPVGCGLFYDGRRHEVIPHSERCRRSFVDEDVE